MTHQLDPDARALLEVMSAMDAPQAYELTIEEAREQMRAALVGRAAAIPLHDVQDVSLPTPHGPLALRLFRPVEGSLPAALFLHGGGWTVNDLDTHDRLCRLIARRSGCLVAALDGHRRAPEHKYPARTRGRSPGLSLADRATPADSSWTPRPRRWWEKARVRPPLRV